MIRLLFVFALFILPLSLHAQEWQKFPFKSGDLLFQDLDCGDLCDAIEKVTPSVNGRHFSHVGLVYVVADSTYVIEAYGTAVQITPLRAFMARQYDSLGKPKVAVGRLKDAYQNLNARAVGFALKQLGTPYDELFLYGNGKYYCSELIYDAYMQANDGRPFFTLYPMTYKDPATGKTFPAWRKYFKSLHHKIPEGREGCNPASVALSSNVRIITSFY